MWRVFEENISKNDNFNKKKFHGQLHIFERKAKFNVFYAILDVINSKISGGGCNDPSCWYPACYKYKKCKLNIFSLGVAGQSSPYKKWPTFRKNKVDNTCAVFPCICIPYFWYFVLVTGCTLQAITEAL